MKKIIIILLFAYNTFSFSMEMEKGKEKEACKRCQANHTTLFHVEACKRLVYKNRPCLDCGKELKKDNDPAHCRACSKKRKMRHLRKYFAID